MSYFLMGKMGLVGTEEISIDRLQLSECEPQIIMCYV